MIDRILSIIEEHQMIQQGDHVTVGLSGGADSVALLCILQELAPRFRLILSACHINHQLRGAEGDSDEQFCRMLCEEMKIPIVVRKIDVKNYCKANKLSSEMGARELRYQALLEESPGMIATAHHADDNAETVLINLLRGTSLDGLCGIAPKRDRIIRPLLGVNRNELEQYLRKIGRCFCTDYTNLTDEFLRNRIRHHLIPMLEQENPSFSQGMLRMTNAMRREREMLEGMAQELLTVAALPLGPVTSARLVGLPLTPMLGRWSRAMLLAQPQPLRLRSLRLICTDYSIPFDQDRLLLLDQFLCKMGSMQLSSDLRLIVTEQSFTLEKRLYLAPITPIVVDSLAKQKSYPLGSGRELLLRCLDQDELKLFVNIFNYQFENLLDCDRINGILTLRSRQEGDTMRLYRRDVTKTFKKLMNEARVPTGLRAGLAMLADDQGPIWIEGFGASGRAVISPQSQRAILLEIREETNDDAG